MVEWTPEQMADFRRELNAIHALLDNLMPEDDLARLAIDPKRQSAAAQMGGTVILAKDLLAKTFKRLDTSVNGIATNMNKNGRGGGRPPAPLRGRSGPYIVKRLERATAPVTRSSIAHDAVTAGVAAAPAAVYGTIQRLVKDGRVKLNKDSTVELIRQ